MTSPIAKEFLHQSVHYIEMNTPRIIKCLNELPEEELWKRPNESSNSIGNLILHLCGNIRQWIISSLGGQPDVRVRESEFSARGGFTKAQLQEKLSSTVAEAVIVILQMDEEKLVQIRPVQGFSYSGIGIIVHVTEHYSYHTGQIAFRTKQLKDKDLGFYSGRDLNVKNRN